MSSYAFIDRFFESQFELLETGRKDDRDANTLYTFLNNLHSTADRLKDDFDCNIKSYPEFKLLRIVRNYMHHVGDVVDIRVKVVSQPGVLVSHSEHLIIPLETLVKSIKSFMDKNLLPESRRDYKSKKKYVDNEIKSISEMFSYIYDILEKIEILSNKPCLRLDGVVSEFGFDMYKFAYNITNIIADECRKIDKLKDKIVVKNLEDSYSSSFNIPRNDVFCLPDNIPLLTTEGFVYANKVEKV
jgi:hypothetical protein